MNTREQEKAEHAAKLEARQQVEHAAIVEHQRKVLRAAVWRSCLNCDHWTEVTIAGGPVFKHCGIYRQVPPPEVIVNGCHKWEDDIPF